MIEASEISWDGLILKNAVRIESVEIQTTALFCSWKEKTRSNRGVAGLACILLSFSFFCGYSEYCCLPIKAMN